MAIEDKNINTLTEGNIEENNTIIGTDSLGFAVGYTFKKLIAWITNELEKANLKKVEDVLTMAELRTKVGVVGQYKNLLGYYEAGDKPELLYKWVSGEAEDDGGSVIESVGGYWSACFMDIVDVRDFGAKGGSLNDDTEHIQRALSFSNKRHIVINDEYNIQASTKLKLKSNTIVEFKQKGKLKALKSWRDISSVLDIVDVDNITIINPNIEGDRYLVDYTTEGAAHGISCRNVTNLNIIGGNISNCFTDGLYLNNVTNTYIYNVVSDNNRRQGMSVTSAVNLYCGKSTFKNTNGTPPSMGIDIEPNNANEKFVNVVFDNIKTENCQTYGIGINLNNLNNLNEVIDITIKDWKDIGSGSAFSAHCYAGNTSNDGEIKIKNMSCFNNENAGVTILGYKSNNTPNIMLDSPYIYNCNTSNGSNERHNSVGISISTDTSGYPKGVNQGNVIIKNPSIVMPDNREISRGIYVGYNENVDNVRIEGIGRIEIGNVNTISNNNNRANIGFSATNMSNVNVYDNINNKIIVPNTTTLFRNYNSAVFSLIETNNTSNAIVFRDFAKWGVLDYLKIIHSGNSSIPLTIELPSNVTFLKQDNTIIYGSLKTLKQGDVIIFKKITKNKYLIQIFGDFENIK